MVKIIPINGKEIAGKDLPLFFQDVKGMLRNSSPKMKRNISEVNEAMENI